MNATVNILTYILEDDFEVHEIIKDMLHDNGVENFSLYDDPKKFVEALNADISICVIDHYLTGGISGIDVIRDIKKKNSFSYVIIMSAQQDFLVGIMYLNEGAEKYIYKHWSQEEINAILPDWSRAHSPTYLDVLIKYLKVGFEEARKRVQLVKLIDSQLAKTDD